MQRKNKIFFFYLGLILFFMSGTLYVTDDFKSFYLIALVTGIVLIWFSNDFMIFVLKRDSKINGGGVLAFLYSAFSVSLIFSLIMNKEKSMIITILGLLLIIWCCIIQIPNYCKKHNVSFNSIYIILMISMLTVFLYSIMRYGIKTVNYEGIFSNQNAMGGNATTLFCISSACFLDNFKKKEKNTKKILWLSVISMLMSTALAFFATSRTSVLSIFVCFLVSLLILIGQASSKKYAFRVSLIILEVIIFILFVYLFTPFKSVVDRFLYKFALHVQDQLNGRRAIWEIIFNRLSYFGNGEASAIAAHNTYLSLMDQYGIISGGLWVLFCFFGIVISFFDIFNKQKEYRHLPFLAFLIFSLQSITEGMMLKTIMLIMIFSISIILNNMNYSSEKQLLWK